MFYNKNLVNIVSIQFIQKIKSIQGNIQQICPFIPINNLNFIEILKALLKTMSSKILFKVNIRIKIKMCKI